MVLCVLRFFGFKFLEEIETLFYHGRSDDFWIPSWIDFSFQTNGIYGHFYLNRKKWLANLKSHKMHFFVLILRSYSNGKQSLSTIIILGIIKMFSRLHITVNWNSRGIFKYLSKPCSNRFVQILHFLFRLTSPGPTVHLLSFSEIDIKVH